MLDKFVVGPHVEPDALRGLFRACWRSGAFSLLNALEDLAEAVDAQLPGLFEAEPEDRGDHRWCLVLRLAWSQTSRDEALADADDVHVLLGLAVRATELDDGLSVIDAFEERAAIAEFDGELSREDAERLALEQLPRCF